MTLTRLNFAILTAYREAANSDPAPKMANIARSMGLHRSGLHHHVKRLVDAGLMTRSGISTGGYLYLPIGSCPTCGQRIQSYQPPS